MTATRAGARTASRTARERARAELTREIKAEARRQLAINGAQQLSLRAVARDLGMASSAIYRYFPSRDELLTELIIDAYDSLGGNAEGAERGVPRDDIRRRWQVTCNAVRNWALAHPHEYALIYGSPVPGYQAPQATIAPAGRVAMIIGQILADARPERDPAAVTSQPAATNGQPATTPSQPAPDQPATANGNPAATPSQSAANPGQPAATPGQPTANPGQPAEAGHSRVSRPLRPNLAEQVDGVAAAIAPGVPGPIVARTLIAWTQLFGMISFELFRQLVGSVDPADDFFAYAVEEMADFVGLPLAETPSPARLPPR